MLSCKLILIGKDEAKLGETYKQKGFVIYNSYVVTWG